jgi:ribosomal protein S18 acetylase RimI-like enzyme
VGVAERGELGPSHVVWKLYVHPEHRGKGLGPALLRQLIGQLPAGAASLEVEHLEVNRRAGEFYEREGFRYVRTESDPVNPAMNIVWRELKLVPD